MPAGFVPASRRKPPANSRHYPHMSKTDLTAFEEVENNLAFYANEQTRDGSLGRRGCLVA